MREDNEFKPLKRQKILKRMEEEALGEDKREFEEVEQSIKDADTDIRNVVVKVLPPEQDQYEDDRLVEDIVTGKINSRGKKRSGKKGRIELISNYERAMSLLDSSVIDAIQVLIEGLDDSNKYYRFKCAELLLKKTVPDKKLIGVGVGKDIPVNQTTTKEIDTAIMEVEGMIEEQMKKRSLIS